MVSSRLLEVELHAASQRRGIVRAHVDELLSRISLVALDDDVVDRAVPSQSGLRSLDALHLATAVDIAHRLTGMLSFDAEVNRAARCHGLASAFE
nr:PIN domain-containing protein [Microbacterium pseudoresistens]